MKRLVPALAAVAVVAGVTLLTSDEETLGPVPICFGEKATHVFPEGGQFNPRLEPERYDELIARYQPWIDQGVVIVVEPDAAFAGTTGHDVMVSFDSTFEGGVIGVREGATAGDSMCSYGQNDDLYYGTGFSDKIYDEGGGDFYYLGGCHLEGKGSVGDRGCDVVIDIGDPGKDALYNGIHSSGRDGVWGYKVPAGRTQRLDFGDSLAWTHVYAGRGGGKVVVDGGECFTRTKGVVGIKACTGEGGQVGDHIHPCPVTDLVGVKIEHTNIEYVGPESKFSGDPFDPCAYGPAG